MEGLTKRTCWRLGQIIQLIQGSDNQCRAAVVKTFDGSNNRLFRRPIEKLYPIEIQSGVPVDESEVNVNNDHIVTTSDGCTSTERPHQVAQTQVLYSGILGTFGEFKGECQVIRIPFEGGNVKR